MTIREAERSDLPAIKTLLRNSNDIPYDLSVVAEEKCFGVGVLGAPRTLLAFDGSRLAGVAVNSPRAIRLLAVDRSLRRRGIGSALLRQAESGLKIVHAGAEPGNYFVPGIPAGDEGLRSFFQFHGYEQLPDSAVDLEVQLRNNDQVRAPDEPDIARATPGDQPAALEFINGQFGRAWRVEVERAFEHPRPTLFIARRRGQIVGFSAHDCNNRGLGFFGPEGVVPEERGRGLGRNLLLASLADLRDMGFERTIIAWAAAHDFYRRVAGAVVAHRFLRMRKSQ